MSFTRQLLTAVLLLMGLALAAMACEAGQRSAGPSEESSQDGEITFRFLLGGWMIPIGQEAGPFVERLEVRVIQSEEQMRDFLEGADLFRLRGNTDILGDADFTETLIVASYYLWRPLKGDPLSVEKVFVDEGVVHVDMLLEADPQGRERPYLLAPMYMFSLDKEVLREQGAGVVRFILNGTAVEELPVSLD